MAEYRYFGGDTILRGATLTQYGQRVESEPEEADALIAAHPPALILPEKLWDEIFPPGPETDKELADYPSVANHGTAPEAFLAKTKAVRVAFHLYRESLLKHEQKGAFAPPPAEPAGEPKSDAAKLDGAVEAEPKG